MDLDHDSAVPLYQQIADLLRADIERGVYPSGSVLPSLEQIKGDTGVTVKTVQKGIRLLIEEGLVFIVAGKGTYVAARP